MCSQQMKMMGATAQARKGSLALYLPALTLSILGGFSTVSPLPQTAPPLFAGKPFAVVWNAPTPVCQKQEVPLDMSAFQAVTTPANEPDQFLSLFYAARIGLYPYTDHTSGKQHNGGIPQRGDLRASLVKEQDDVTRIVPKEKAGLGVIDWEEWRPLWARNWGSKDIYRQLSVQLVQEEDPSLTSQQARDVAKKQFQASARAYMEGSVKLAIHHRANYLWGYYLFPDCYSYDWDQPGYTGDCSEQTKSQNDELLWLWESSTALFPSVYLPLELRDSHNAALFVRGRVQEAVRVSALPHHPHTAPIFVYSRPLFRDQSEVYLSELDLVRSIGESAALGAAGVVLWGASVDYNNKESCEALSAYLDSTLNSYVANVTAAAQLCSDLLCQGNGRCVRKQHSADDYLHLNPLHFDILGGWGRYQAVGVPSLGDIQEFADKFTCQCYAGRPCSAQMPVSLPQTPVVIEVSAPESEIEPPY